jgi:hypothetical protein
MVMNLAVIARGTAEIFLLRHQGANPREEEKLAPLSES